MPKAQGHTDHVGSRDIDYDVDVDQLAIGDVPSIEAALDLEMELELIEGAIVNLDDHLQPITKRCIIGDTKIEDFAREGRLDIRLAQSIFAEAQLRLRGLVGHKLLS